MSWRAHVIVSITLSAALHAAAETALNPGASLEVRVLYDNSGSMYAGYRPPGSPDRRSRADLGVGYFHQSPSFTEWLGDFARRQTILDGGSIGMWTFTADGQFTPAGIQQVHPVVPIADFDAAAAIRQFPARVGDRTYLTETVDAFTRGFTGLLWLITDNIVETNDGLPDAGVQTFFQALSRRSEIRSVHLLKYTFEEGGQTAAIAVYGMLISARDVPPATLQHYDTKFEMLRDAKRSRGNPPPDLFPGREFLKLKDLSIGPLRPELRLVLNDDDTGRFREGQTIRFDVEGAIRSFLTQHTVTAGRFELAIATPFVPEEWARLELGAQAMPQEGFSTVSGELEQAIPPLGSQAVTASLESRQPSAFSPHGIAEWLRLAWDGATVRYTGTIEMSFTDVRVRLEPQRMAGIFGIDRATTAFSFQDVRSLPDVPPARVPVSFVLRTGNSRSTILVIVLAAVAALLLAATFLLSKKRAFRVLLSREPEMVVALRPLGHHDVRLEGKVLGRLSRGLGSYSFEPRPSDPTVTVTPAKDAEEWDVRIDGASRRLSIKAEGGGKSKPRKAAAPGGLVTAPPPPVPRNAPPPLPGRPPKIGRH